MIVGVNGDVAGGVVSATLSATLDGIAIIGVGDAVASHPPCPVVPIHCSPNMATGTAATIDGVLICVTGDTASCGHALAGTSAADLM